MASSSQSTGQLSHEAAERAVRRFADKFGRSAQWVVAAPGRVNLIGEHTDYNDGFVLPMAIDRYTVIAAAARDDARLRLGSGLIDTLAETDAASLDLTDQPGWAKYVIGTLTLCAGRDMRIGAVDAWIESDVPLGSGLSSSAALEVATATLAEAISGKAMDPMDKAKLCQQAEHEYAGVPCGIMDQATSAAAIEGCAILLDCRSGEIRPVKMADPNVAVLIANTHVHHELNDGGYALRRKQCEQAAAAIGVPALRDASMDQLDAVCDRIDDVVYRRGRHVIGEIARTLDAAEAFERRDWAKVGKLMYASHASLRDDFEVSCAELDVMVEIASEIGEAGGVIGSRMTGGGFGGCTVSLVRADHADAIAKRLHEEYQKRTEIEPAVFVTVPSRGAHVIAG